MKKIVAIVGSLSSRSSNLAVVKHVAGLIRDKCEVELYDGIRDLPQFNPDLDGGPEHPEVAKLRDKIRNADLIFICTPEYVFGVPGSLKNALDWTVSTADLRGKNVALIVASLSGEKAFESLLKTLETLEAVICDGCALLISHVKAKISADGKIFHEETRSDLELFVQSLKLCLGK